MSVMNSGRVGVVGLAMLGAMAGTAATAQCDMSRTDQLTSPVPPQAGEGFGNAVAVWDGGTTGVSLIAVAAPFYDANASMGATEYGRVSIFSRAPGAGIWTWEVTLIGGSMSQMGTSLAITGDTLVCGAPTQSNLDTGVAGAAIVYTRVVDSGTGLASWNRPPEILTASDGLAGDDFGHDVAIHLDGTIVVGARNDDHPGATNAGSVYIFRRSGAGPTTYTWSQFQKLVPSVSMTAQAFGKSVAIGTVGTRSVVMVGASGETVSGLANAGAVYFYTRNTLTPGSMYGTVEADRVTHPTPAANDFFGFDVGISGSTAVVGAWGDDVTVGPSTIVDTGTVHLFTGNVTASTWTHAGQFAMTDLATGDGLGTGVAISGDTILCTAPQDDEAGTNRGAAYAMRRINGVWSSIDKILPTNNFASACALAGEIGVFNAGTTSSDAVDVYRIRQAAFSTQPAGRTVGGNCTAAFSAAVEAPAATTVQWQFKEQTGTTWANILNGPNTASAGAGGGYLFDGAGATTLNLTLSHPGVGSWSMPGFVRCIVTTPCGTATSDEAALSLSRVDINCSGGISVQDIFDFLAAFFAGAPEGDFNGVNGHTVQDIFDFLGEYFGGRI